MALQTDVEARLATLVPAALLTGPSKLRLMHGPSIPTLTPIMHSSVLISRKQQSEKFRNHQYFSINSALDVDVPISDILLILVSSTSRPLPLSPLLNEA
jgi:hypothetical protein